MASKTATKHPYAAIEHRVIDSLAYADLTFSARSLLVLLTRQLTKDNNGHLQATVKYLSRWGYSDRTITRGIQELIAHGFICRTRCGGFHQGASQYAVTWLSITRRSGLYLDGFKMHSWRDWTPPENKNIPAKLRLNSRKNGGLTPPTTDKFTTGKGDKFTDNELIPCRGVVSALSNRQKNVQNPLSPWRKFRLTRRPVNLLLHYQLQQPEHHADNDERFTRTKDDTVSQYWDSDLGEFRKPPIQQSATRLTGMN